MLRARKAPNFLFFVELIVAILGLCLLPSLAEAINDNIQHWAKEFPYADFTLRAVNISEIRYHGATRDTVRPLVKPSFGDVKTIRNIGEIEPVISVEVNHKARAYPLRYLVWHELVNDELAGVPILISYSPLTNSARVYERWVSKKVALFGNTGRTRHFDTIIYDAETQSWWQRYTGRAILGLRTGSRLRPIASRLESVSRFKNRYSDGQIMLPPNLDVLPYGTTPYIRMGSSVGNGLEAYILADDINPYDRIVAIGDEAWTFKRLREKGAVMRDGIFIGWIPGQNSIHDTKWIHFGRDVGNIVVGRFDTKSDEWVDVLHSVGFAFAFRAFNPSGVLYSW
ncbi:MAG: hypothetical protein CMF69_10120 [Magnetovibrio sp.]|nr:hypothetical protein [Magnetovibrio sp.]|tara:strand:- start:2335 stop:3354 length:1020 start_codon:yes stop_codon:yes gene_type:complete